MPVETGVVTNGKEICCDIPNMGQWFGQAGYETVYCGKWHLGAYYTNTMPGFTVLSTGNREPWIGEGDTIDNAVSRSCEAWLKTSGGDRPFLLVASLLQPHDICYWAIFCDQLVPQNDFSDEIIRYLPDTPRNLHAHPQAPARLAQHELMPRMRKEIRWRYYNYIYYRQVEMLDSDLGRILDALDDAGLTDDTIILFTSDHGEGGGHHGKVQKWTPYEESVKVPLVFSCPERFCSDLTDKNSLVSGIDIMPTLCDLAAIESPPGCVGKSLRPLVEGKTVSWRDYVVAEVFVDGIMVRTSRYKYFRIKNDPVEQLFDMVDDALETTNLFFDAKYADVVKEHQKLLSEWQQRTEPVIL
jgi:arylsulfatase A-like enzyme